MESGQDAESTRIESAVAIEMPAATVDRSDTNGGGDRPKRSFQLRALVRSHFCPTDSCCTDAKDACSSETAKIRQHLLRLVPAPESKTALIADSVRS